MDPAKRAKYDQWLNSGVLIPWKEWSNLTEKSQTVRFYIYFSFITFLLKILSLFITLDFSLENC